MKNFIASLFILCSLSVFSQTKHEDGPYKEYHENGQLRKEGYYKSDKKVSVWKEYYDNGQLKRVYTFNADGTSSGIEEMYSKNGNLVSERKRAQNDGFVYKEYFDNGKLYITYALVPSKNNNYFIKSGGYKEYYENGALKIESSYLKSELDGEWKRYLETGEKEWEVAYFDGYKQGTYKQFYKNGKIKLEGWNEGDFKNGEEKRYNEKGNLIWKGSYLKDYFDDIWTQYDSIGNVINSLKYSKGKPKKSANLVALVETEIPDGLLERVPVYPGCEDSPGNTGKKVCMSKKIQEFINKKFDTNVLKGTGMTGIMRINVGFKIDNTGKVTNIKVKASHRDLEREAIDVVSELPRMKPGMQRGKAVTVPYALPMVFSVSRTSERFPTNNNTNGY